MAADRTGPWFQGAKEGKFDPAWGYPRSRMERDMEWFTNPSGFYINKKFIHSKADCGMQCLKDVLREKMNL
jgi:hypothetical protein